MIRRIKLLIILAGLAGMCAACGVDEPSVHDAVPSESALTSQEIQMAQDVWAYYTGSRTAGLPVMTMKVGAAACGCFNLGGGRCAYRIPLNGFACAPDVLNQSTLAPYNFIATYEYWDTGYPSTLQPWEATLAVNALCIAAYRQARWADAQIQPRCSGDPSSTVPAVRALIHSRYNSSRPMWVTGI